MTLGRPKNPPLGRTSARRRARRSSERLLHRTTRPSRVSRPSRRPNPTGNLRRLVTTYSELLQQSTSQPQSPSFETNTPDHQGRNSPEVGYANSPSLLSQQQSHPHGDPPSSSFTRTDLRLSIQAQPNHAPLPIQVHIAYQGTQPTATGAHIQVSSLSPQQRSHPPKRRPRRDDDGNLMPAKRAHVDSSSSNTSIAFGAPFDRTLDMTSGGWTSEAGIELAPDTPREADQPLDPIQHPPLDRSSDWPLKPRTVRSVDTLRHPGSMALHQDASQDEQDGHDNESTQETDPFIVPARYVVDLGLIRAFPTLDDDVCSVSISDVYSNDGYLSNDQECEYNDDNGTLNSDVRIPARLPVPILSWDIALLISTFLMLPCLVAVCLYPNGPELASPMGHVSNAVDWFERASLIEAGITTVSRLLMFGESPATWCEQSNNPPDDDAQASCQFQHEPWETTSNGSFVEERLFLDDLQKVVFSSLSDLQFIANHGPPSFRFTRGHSTQFRWSTSSGSFYPPHASLSTYTQDTEDRLRPGSTIRGMPSDGASPTARPEYPSFIYNLDPPLSQLERDLKQTFHNFKMSHSATRRDMKFVYLPSGERRAKLFISRLRDLQRKFTQNDWGGSDQDRVRCLAQLHKPDIPPHTINDTDGLGSSISLLQLPRNMNSLPGDADESVFDAFKDAYRKARDLLPSQVKLAEKASSGKHPVTPCFTSQLNRDDWSGIQKKNQTAKELVDILDITVELELGHEHPEDEFLPREKDLVTYKDHLIAFCDLMDDFYDRIQQALRGLLPDNDPGLTPLVRGAITRIRDSASFLEAIAPIRLSDMRRRAKMGAALLEQLEEYQQELGKDIERTIYRGWVTPDGRPLYLPALKDILEECELGYSWMHWELANIRRLDHDRQDLSERRIQNSMAGIVDESHIIWSRWGPEDHRQDPAGSEALCWDHGPLEGTGRGYGWHKAMRCGDASARHGKVKGTANP